MCGVSRFIRTCSGVPKTSKDLGDHNARQHRGSAKRPGARVRLVTQGVALGGFRCRGGFRTGFYIALDGGLEAMIC